MRAVRIVDGAATVVDVGDPADPGDDEVAIDVVSSGICGSDLHLLPFGLPVTFGHEVEGVLPDGRRVAVEPTSPCGTCDRCAAGQDQQCAASMAAVYGVSADGGMADHMVVRRSSLVELPDEIDRGDACLVEPLAVAVHAVHRADVQPGHRVLVVGAGMIGLACAAAALDAGADVDVVARHNHQRVAVERIGASAREGKGYDVAIEAVGSGSALASAISACRPGATISAPGTYWDGLEITNVLEMFQKEVSFVPSATYGHHHGVREIDQAAALLAKSPELADTVITHRYGLDDAAEAFRVAADRAAGAIKVVLEP